MPACYEYAAFLASGYEGKPPELRRAGIIHEQTCRAGLVSSCSAVVSLHYDKKYVIRDLSTLTAVFDQACGESDPIYACFWLAEAYEYGIGVKKDLERAEDIYRLVCAYDVLTACERLSEVGAPRRRVFSLPKRQLIRQSPSSRP